VALNINETNADGELIGHDDVFIQLTKPLRTLSQEVTLKDSVVLAASCVLPGLDPRCVEAKQCQDNAMVWDVKGYLLAALFDGHGANGRQVVETAASFIGHWFEVEIDRFIVSVTQHDPIEALTTMIEDCELHVNERIDTTLSGSTAVMLLVTPTYIYSANLGDSRGILACVPGPTSDLKQPRNMTRSTFKRLVVPGRMLVSLAITLDQKPNQQEEMKRIHQAGGIIQRLASPSGRKQGPYRVWKPETTLPGLAMSRSLGDSMAKSIGVIATPVVQQFTLEFERDLFAVIASDGVW
jgi:serine/threonine protein phosphatase PrpC